MTALDSDSFTETLSISFNLSIFNEYLFSLQKPNMFSNNNVSSSRPLFGFAKIFNILKSEKYNQKNIELIKKNIHHNIKDNLISSPLRGLHFKNCLYIALQIAKLFKISKNIY